MNDTHADEREPAAQEETEAALRPSAAAWALQLPLRFYRKFISPLFPPICRFHPSCSAYAVEALSRHGAARGSYLAARRLLRCGPWTWPGLDPVPETFSFRYQRPDTPTEE